ncbi:unnamed protein product [Effrenium voratum]|nr:unnamed protein product [Effrenium voratum]
MQTSEGKVAAAPADEIALPARHRHGHRVAAGAARGLEEDPPSNRAARGRRLQKGRFPVATSAFAEGRPQAGGPGAGNQAAAHPRGCSAASARSPARQPRCLPEKRGGRGEDEDCPRVVWRLGNVQRKEIGAGLAGLRFCWSPADGSLRLRPALQRSAPGLQACQRRGPRGDGYHLVGPDVLLPADHKGCP